MATKYIIRQPDKADREFESSREAIEYLVSNPGYAKLFHENELLMTKGWPPHLEHDPQNYRGLFSAAAEA